MRKKKKAMYPDVVYFYDSYFSYNFGYAFALLLGPTGTGKTWVNSVRKSMPHKNKQ